MSSVEVSRAGQVSVSSRVTRFGDVADPMHRRPCLPPGAAELRVVETTSEQVEADDNAF